MGRAGRGGCFRRLLNQNSALELINLKCLLDIQEGISSRQLNIGVWIIARKSGPDIFGNVSIRVTLASINGRTNWKYFQKAVYDTVIPRNVRLAEAPSHGVPIMLHDTKCVGAKTYLALTEEFLEKQPKKKNVK